MDSIFIDTILMMIANTTETHFLMQILAVAMETLGIEKGIIGLNCLDSFPNISSLPLKQEIPMQGVSWIEGMLGRMQNLLTDMIHPDSTANKTIVSQAVTRMRDDTPRR